MHPTFIFLLFLELFSFQVAGHPRHGPFEGPFQGPFHGPYHGPPRGPSPNPGPGQSSSVGKGVKTSSGTILGQPAFSRPEVSEYLGIPFAKPPVGDLRFAPPQAFTGTANVNATAFVSIQSEIH